MATWAGVILAAGKGTRMKSRIPKALHCVAGVEMLSWVKGAVSETPVTLTAAVVGPEFPTQHPCFSNGMNRVLQGERLGTGHALLQTQSLIAEQADHVLVVNADMPLLTPDTLNRMIDRHLGADAALTLLTCRTEEPGEMGRVIRGPSEEITGVVEWRDANTDIRSSNEVCCGVYCFQSELLWPALQDLSPAPNGEFYITSLIEKAHQSGFSVESVSPADPDEALGVNDRSDLARVTAVAFERTRQRAMARGVTLVDPPSTFIDAPVSLGIDTALEPGVILQGETSIGGDCTIGPNAIIRDSSIGDECRIQGSVIEGTSIADRVEVGPYCHLRPGARLAEDVHIGNYVEIKETTIGPGTKVGHFSYLGDAEVGANVNIGAGSVTCNYDGESKNRTIIGDGAFIGSDSMLVAPVRIGARAVTGAGSVVTGDLSDGALAYGVPAREKPRDQVSRRNGEA